MALQFWPALSQPGIARNTERVATLFRILQHHYRQFVQTLTLQITSHTEFERLAAPNADTLTDLERACRLAFRGKVASRNFGIESDSARESSHGPSTSWGSIRKIQG